MPVCGQTTPNGKESPERLAGTVLESHISYRHNTQVFHVVIIAESSLGQSCFLHELTIVTTACQVLILGSSLCSSWKPSGSRIKISQKPWDTLCYSTLNWILYLFICSFIDSFIFFPLYQVCTQVLSLQYVQWLIIFSICNRPEIYLVIRFILTLQWIKIISTYMYN